MKEQVEMSVLDKRLPRYYKGYNMDDILYKIKNNIGTTEKEDEIIIEVYDICHKKMAEDNKKLMQEEIQKNKAPISFSINNPFVHLSKQQGEQNES